MCTYRSSANCDAAPTAEAAAPTGPDGTGDALAEMLSSLMLDNADMKKSMQQGKQMIDVMNRMNSKMEAEFRSGVAPPPPSPETTTGKRARSDISELDTAQHQNKQAQCEAEDVGNRSTEDLLRLIAQERRVRDEYTRQVVENSVEIKKLQEQHRQLAAALRELKAAALEEERERP
jgi:uncharacterized coiled-coil protein SlyX